MKKLILILLLINTFCKSQTCVSNVLQISENESFTNKVSAGSCASPDGPDKLTGSPPPSYAWLQANGYCYTINPATSAFTMCFTFTSTATTATFNSGYSSTGCAGISFSGFNLYTCNPACTFIGSGLTFFGLTIGQCYTWCFSGNCIGPGPGFTSVCPYYMQITPLPIELVEFNCKVIENSVQLKWSTYTEKNSKYFIIYKSKDGLNYNKLSSIPAAKNSNHQLTYYSFDNNPNDINYYKLVEVDLNGEQSTFNPIVCDFKQENESNVKYFNLIGQEVEITNMPSGLYIKQFNYKGETKLERYLKN